MRFVRRFPPYHEIRKPAERRRAVVALHAEGWSTKAIAGYLRVHRSTVDRVLRLAAGAHSDRDVETLGVATDHLEEIKPEAEGEAHAEAYGQYAELYARRSR